MNKSASSVFIAAKKSDGKKNFYYKFIVNCCELINFAKATSSGFL
jgi:hypothetical protein